MTFLRRASLFFVGISLLAHFVRAQCPMPPVEIQNFHGTTTVADYTINWDPVSNPEAVYQVMQATGPNYCAFPTDPNAYTPVGTTSSTTFTAPKSTPNVAYFVFVWLQSDHCVATHYTLLTDSFTSPPTKPVITTAVASSADVTVTFSYGDVHAYDLILYRIESDNTFHFADSTVTCVTDPKTVTDKNVAAGTYQYVVTAYNTGTAAGIQGVDSEPVTVVVGGGGLQITSFAATPPTIRAGQSAILSWNTRGATSVLIDNGVGTEPPSGSVSVSPTNTTMYTLTAMNGANSVMSTATVNVLTAPIVVVSAFPSGLLQARGVGGATTSYTLTNAGGTTTTITLGQNGTFFTQDPPSMTLAPGASQRVTISGLAQNNAGSFQGASIPSGTGVPSGLQIPIKLLSATPPAGTVTAAPTTNRVDVNQPGGGSVTFTNDNDATLTGILVSDVPWLIPQPGVVIIPPHSPVTVTFTINRSQRSDSAAPVGSTSGNLTLVYLSGPAAKIGRNDVAPVSVSFVTVVDTVQLSVSATAPPALSPGEVALFVPGVGHTPGSVGLFISDVAVLNPLGSAVNDLRFYFTPRSQGTESSKSAAVSSVPSSVSVALADVVKNVFGADAEVGSLQIRSSVADKLGVSTNSFVSSNPKGTFGTAIPTFRSDRAVGAGERLFLTGLAQEPTFSHTNLFIQETAGVGVSVHTEFLSADGSTLSTRDDGPIGPFTLLQIGGAVPNGAVSAVMTNTSTGTGRFLAYATPVDEKSSDTWSVVDWSRQFGYSQSEAVVVPVATKTQGISGFFRTDAAIMNTGSTFASGTLRYVSGGVGIDRQITLGARQTSVIADLTATLFGITTSTVGYLVFTPVNGTFAITSRTYATLPSEPGTFGSGTPTLALATALKNGSLRAIGSLEDALAGSVKRPATFRTNFGLSEVTGNSVTVRVTLRFTYPAGAKVQGIGTAFRDYHLDPNQYMQVNGMAKDILGANRETIGDLRGFEADFQVIDGTGAVTVFTSSVDNGTADSILRTE